MTQLFLGAIIGLAIGLIAASLWWRRKRAGDNDAIMSLIAKHEADRIRLSQLGKSMRKDEYPHHD